MEKLQVAAITCKYIHFIVPKEIQNNRKIFEEIMATVFFSLTNNKYRPTYIRISTNPVHKKHKENYIQRHKLTKLFKTGDKEKSIKARGKGV